MIKKCRLGISIFLMMVLMMGVIPNNAKAMSDSDMDSAQSLVLGQKQKGSTGDELELWFKFTTSSNKESWYRIGCIFKSDSNFGPTMNLYTEDGEKLFLLELNKGEDNTKHIKLEPNTTYYVHLNFAKNTDYTAYVNELKDDCGDSEDNAAPIYSGIKKKGNFECAIDQDAYSITAGASKTNINMTLKYKDRSSEVSVYNEDGVELLKEVVYDGKSENYTVETKKGEKYYIIVRSIDSSIYFINYSGTYTLTVKSGPTDKKGKL